MKLFTYLCAACTLVLVGGGIACEDPANKVAPATVKDLPAETSTPKSDSVKSADPSKGQAVAAQVSEGLSKLTGEVIFIGSKISGYEQRCEFTDWSGQVAMAGDVIQPESLSFSVKTAGILCDSKEGKGKPKLEEHLRHDDFFGSAQFPTASFKASAIRAEAGKDGATHVITGALQIRDVTKSIEFPLRLTKMDKGYEGVAKFRINRQEFNVRYQTKKDDLINDGVVLELNLKTVE